MSALQDAPQLLQEPLHALAKASGHRAHEERRSGSQTCLETAQRAIQLILSSLNALSILFKSPFEPGVDSLQGLFRLQIAFRGHHGIGL